MVNLIYSSASDMCQRYDLANLNHRASKQVVHKYTSNIFNKNCHVLLYPLNIKKHKNMNMANKADAFYPFGANLN